MNEAVTERNRGRLVIVLAVIVGIVCVGSSFMAAWALVEVDQQQQRLQDVLVNSQVNRQSATRAFCDAINDNARQANNQSVVIQTLIVSGAKESAIFEPIYKQYGAPPYRDRVREARTAAAQIEKRRIPVLNCDIFVTEVEAVIKEAERAR